MSFVIAAAGTGGHVFPGLAVAEALIDQGVEQVEILFVGGDRMESTVYPDEGFPFLQVEMRGLRRSLSAKNLGLPKVVLQARDDIELAIEERKVEVALAMGGYITIPAGLAARKAEVPLMLAEQNARAGLANRVASRWAVQSFTSFPATEGLERGEWVGNPVRRSLAGLDRAAARPEALTRFDIDPGLPTLGVFGGSLGAGVINDAVGRMVEEWDGPPIQVVHVTGPSHLDEMMALKPGSGATWRRLAFEDRMDLFYAASDLVVARAGGGVAELTATASPSILVPGEFSARGHQSANAAFIADSGAAVIVNEPDIAGLPEVVFETLFDPATLHRMSEAARLVGKPEAAATIARAMLEAAA
jgi:UDP-N-acetylglucosamine--N-acetylmuramyl-(pentapeptide) pyrophosphoryl-undecaprenol N-acetylglucosamine transferase